MQAASSGEHMSRALVRSHREMVDTLTLIMVVISRCTMCRHVTLCVVNHACEGELAASNNRVGTCVCQAKALGLQLPAN
jgi:hypothetical protein